MSSNNQKIIIDYIMFGLSVKEISIKYNTTQKNIRLIIEQYKENNRLISMGGNK